MILKSPASIFSAFNIKKAYNMPYLKQNLLVEFARNLKIQEKAGIFKVLS